MRVFNVQGSEGQRFTIKRQIRAEERRCDVKFREICGITEGFDEMR